MCREWRQVHVQGMETMYMCREWRQCTCTTGHKKYATLLQQERQNDTGIQNNNDLGD